MASFNCKEKNDLFYWFPYFFILFIYDCIVLSTPDSFEISIRLHKHSKETRINFTMLQFYFIRKKSKKTTHTHSQSF